VSDVPRLSPARFSLAYVVPRQAIVNAVLWLLAFTAFVLAAARRGDARIVGSRGSELRKAGLFLIMLALLGELV
jgi:hypothetical protein